MVSKTGTLDFVSALAGYMGCGPRQFPSRSSPPIRSAGRGDRGRRSGRQPPARPPGPRGRGRSSRPCSGAGQRSTGDREREDFDAKGLRGFTDLERVWNPYGNRMAPETVRIKSLTQARRSTPLGESSSTCGLGGCSPSCSRAAKRRGGTDGAISPSSGSISLRTGNAGMQVDEGVPCRRRQDMRLVAITLLAISSRPRHSRWWRRPGRRAVRPTFMNQDAQSSSSRPRRP